MTLSCMTSFSPNINIFEEYNQRIDIWEHPRIWRLEDEECYSDFFLTELKKIKEVLKIFVSEGYSEKYISTYNFKFLRKFAYYFSKTKDIKESFRWANGWAGKLGFEYAKAQLKIFRKKFGRIPHAKDEGMLGIGRSCQKGLWKEFGIPSWNDLLREVFGEVNFEFRKYIGKKAFERAKKRIITFYQEEGRKPLVADLKNIAGASHRGNWKEFGINGWNDLLRGIFNEVNHEQNLWVGKKGYEYAKKILKDYYENNLKLPKAEDFQNICAVIYKLKWKEFGINTWNDLLRKLFGKVNDEKNIYTGFKGLMNVKRILLEFYDENKRLPIYDEKGFGGIASACSSKRWKEFGINGWNDMLYFVFNRINEESRFVSLESYNKVKKDIKAFFEENNRKPFSREFRDIVNAICRGYWHKFGIKTWNDLLIEIFGEVKKKHEEYCGDKGLNKAKEELLLFYKIHGRLPKTRDNLSKIKYAIRARYWEKWNILTWNDLLREVFGKVNNEFNIYRGKKGLVHAKDLLVKFHREHGRIPYSREISSIGGFCSTGYYSDYGINCWNDLLLDVFGKVNFQHRNWGGLDGLERAKKELIQYYSENGRKPTSIDKGFGGIASACNKKRWKEFGINSWLEFKNSTFNKIIFKI